MAGRKGLKLERPKDSLSVELLVSVMAAVWAKL